MKKAKIIIEGCRPAGKRPNDSTSLETLRKWIPCEEFCELYRLPKIRPAREVAPKYSTSKATAARKCCERLAKKGLITTRKIEGRLYVSRDSAISFGDKA
jgi:hypothetical protein